MKNKIKHFVKEGGKKHKDILQKSFYVPQKKESRANLEQNEGE